MSSLLLVDSPRCVGTGTSIYIHIYIFESTSNKNEKSYLKHLSDNPLKPQTMLYVHNIVDRKRGGTHPAPQSAILLQLKCGSKQVPHPSNHLLVKWTLIKSEEFKRNFSFASSLNPRPLFDQKDCTGNHHCCRDAFGIVRPLQQRLLPHWQLC